jgi:hypothetical protein
VLPAGGRTVHKQLTREPTCCSPDVASQVSFWNASAVVCSKTERYCGGSQVGGHYRQLQRIAWQEFSAARPAVHREVPTRARQQIICSKLYHWLERGSDLLVGAGRTPWLPRHLRHLRRRVHGLANEGPGRSGNDSRCLVVKVKRCTLRLAIGGSETHSFDQIHTPSLCGRDTGAIQSTLGIVTPVHSHTPI